jgi:hypothetical protein
MRIAIGLLGAMLCGVTALAAGVASASADRAGCEALPTTARRPRACNPQEECLKLTARRQEGRATSQNALGDCRRLPATGVCYGPDVYDPRAECRARAGK